MMIGIDASRVSKKVRTGVEWYVFHLLNAMRDIATAHAVRLYSRDSLPFSLPENWNTQNLQWPFPFLWTQGGLSLEMLKAPPDLLFIPSSALPLILPRLSVTTIHDVGFLAYRSSYRIRERLYLEWSTQYATQAASHMITVSEFTKQELIAYYGVNPEKITVVSLACDIPPDQSLSELADTRKKFDISQPYLLFISRIDHRKNVAAALAAFRLLKAQKVFDGHFVLAGPLGYDGQSIIDDALQSEFHESIQYLGWISEWDKYALLRQSICFVFPSAYEGFGIPVLEAQSVGVPVVCSRTSSLPEVAGNGALYIDPSSPEDIARGIESVIQHDKLREQLVHDGSVNHARFSWKKTAERTFQVFDTVASSIH